MKKSVLAIIAFLAVFITVEAQGQGYIYIDVVYLKNGCIIKGVIIEDMPNVQVKIQLSNGNIFVYFYNEIQKFTKEKALTSNNKVKNM